MKVVAINDMDFSSRYKTYYIRILRPIICSIAALLGLAILYFAYFGTGIPVVVLLVSSMFCVVFLCISIIQLLKLTINPHWVIKISDKAVFVKFRSYLYRNSSKHDKQVICLKASEIKCFYEINILDIIHQSRTKSRLLRKYIDFMVPGNLSMLRTLLAKEHIEYGLGKEGKFKIEKSYIDFPVSMPNDHTIRINISNLKHKNLFVSDLERFGIKKEDTKNEKFVFLDQSSDSREVMQRIIELLKEGRRLDARNAIEYGFRFSREQTINLINELIRKNLTNKLEIGLSREK